MVQLPSSPRSSASKDRSPDSDATLSPAWSVISGLDVHADSTTSTCLQDTLQFGSGLHHRSRPASSGSAGSDEDLYQAAQRSRSS
jgi:hypothetical protein